MKVTDFINGPVTYDNEGQYFWVTSPNDNMRMLGELRGWGSIQNMFKRSGGRIDMELAAKYQDEIGQWVADAINEKLKRDS
jgi:hypothetical protein